MNSFSITINPTQKLDARDKEDETVSEAIETIYPYGTEKNILLNWNSYNVELDFKYDISNIYNDIIYMMQNLSLINEGEYELTWPSSSFFATWKFLIKDNFLVIESHWTAIKGGAQALKEIQEKPNKISIEKSIFFAEWNKLLLLIKKDLLSAGYDDSLEGFEYLNKLDG